MITQKSATVLSVHNGSVSVEFEDQSRGRFPINGAFPHDIKKGDRILLGVEYTAKYVILVNGESVISTDLKRSWNGYTLSFTSTSDSGYVELLEEDDDRLHVIYKTGNQELTLGTVITEWDQSHTFAILWFYPDIAAHGVRFEYSGHVVDQDRVELFYDRTTFDVISERETVSAVIIREA